MSIYWHIAVFIGTFIAMEGAAWFTHKYVMHGLLWNLHEDHHKVDHDKVFQKNDFFFLIFAIPGATSLMFGILQDYSFLFSIGLGITAYGATYFFVHDLFIHQRLKVLRRTDSIYFRAIRKAHKVHHKHLSKERGECFGMLFVPMRYIREARRSGAKS